MSKPNEFDAWLEDHGPAAVVLREPLQSVEGSDGVIFPATFAAAEDKSKFPGGYNIDPPKCDRNVCLVDSVGSQANRIEPLFAQERYLGLVPQVVIEAGERAINLLDAGHRAGDAIIRCSALRGDLQAAFRAAQQGNAEPLAKVAPTSLVFGVWDSRDTQAKLPRLVSSTVRAFDVRLLSRSAVYMPATEYVANGLLPEPTSTPEKDTYSKRGFIHVPASGAPGGVIATGGVRRDAVLSLGALRLLAVREGKTLVSDRTLVLRRYILGLALVALTYRTSSYLRQGCNLVPDPDTSATSVLVCADGRREPFSMTHDQALAFAQAAAKEFGIGPDRTVPFDRSLAEKDVKGETAEGEPKKRGKK